MRETKWREQPDGSYWMVDKDEPEELLLRGYLAPELVARFQADGCLNLSNYGGNLPDQGSRAKDYFHICEVSEFIEWLQPLIAIQKPKQPWDDEDQLVNDYKDGYRDADGNVNEPDWIEE